MLNFKNGNHFKLGLITIVLSFSVIAGFTSTTSQAGSMQNANDQEDKIKKFDSALTAYRKNLEDKNELEVAKNLIFPEEVSDELRNLVAKLKIAQFRLYKSAVKKLGKDWISKSKYPIPGELRIFDFIVNYEKKQLEDDENFELRSSGQYSYVYALKHSTTFILRKQNEKLFVLASQYYTKNNNEKQLDFIVDRIKAYKKARKYLKKNKKPSLKKILIKISKPISKYFNFKQNIIKVDLSSPKNALLSYRKSLKSGDPTNCAYSSLSTGDDLLSIYTFNCFSKMYCNFLKFEKKWKTKFSSTPDFSNPRNFRLDSLSKLSNASITDDEIRFYKRRQIPCAKICGFKFHKHNNKWFIRPPVDPDGLRSINILFAEMILQLAKTLEDFTKKLDEENIDKNQLKKDLYQSFKKAKENFRAKCREIRKKFREDSSSIESNSIKKAKRAKRIMRRRKIKKPIK